MYPEDPLAAAFTDMVVCQATDCFEPLLATMGIKDPEAKMAARVDLVKATGTVGARMNSLAAYLVGGGGDQVSAVQLWCSGSGRLLYFDLINPPSIIICISGSGSSTIADWVGCHSVNLQVEALHRLQKPAAWYAAYIYAWMICSTLFIRGIVGGPALLENYWTLWV